MARRRREPIMWPSWRYGPNGESAIFQSDAEVPYGWTKRPQEKFVVEGVDRPDKEELIARLIALGIEVNPIWGLAQLQKVFNDSSPAR